MNVLSLFKPITTFILDVDGVLTDGSVLAFESGEQVRRMSTKDGYAIQLAIKKGYRLAVISGGGGTGVQQRLSKLGVKDLYMEVTDKRKKLEEFVETHRLQPEEILYMGDDIPDYSLSGAVGLFCAPADAVPDIQRVAKYISSFAGGNGCVRDVIEKVLRLNNHWDLETHIPSH
jgi:3-deoxy-D-manno-octulosonate 8-phosphate phosphatase (KDO 8-P phosphatase)